MIRRNNSIRKKDEILKLVMGSIEILPASRWNESHPG